MFKHILIPTDGSALAAKAIQAGIKLAKEMGARVTGFYAQAPHPLHLHAQGYSVEKALVTEFDRRARDYAEKTVAQIARAAKAAGVPFEGLVVKSDKPYEAIVAAAKSRKCDAICMASHGQKGLSGMVIGSVTNKVLTHSKIPVLVYR